MVSHYIWIGLGGGLGAALRSVMTHCLPASVSALPFPILLINVLGCFLMGSLTEAMTLYWVPSPALKGFLLTGLLGGFTTFSAFAFEFHGLLGKQLLGWACLYLSMSLSLSLIAFWIGTRLIHYWL